MGDRVSEIVTLSGRLKAKRLPKRKKEVMELLFELSREKRDCFFQVANGASSFGVQMASSPSLDHRRQER